MLKIQCIPANSLIADQIAAWQRIRASDATFDSGFFSPEFTLTIAKYRKDVQVAVFSENDRTVGFFPFHKRRLAPALPVGLLLSDFHGAIVESSVTWDWNSLLRSCSIPGFDYDHLIECQTAHKFSINIAGISPFIEINRDFDTYIEQHRGKTQEISQTLRKMRKASREIGPVHLVYDSKDPQAWGALLKWKTAQYHRTGAADPFSYEWADKFLKDLSQRNSPDLKGIVSCLYFGQRLVAIHFGFSSGNVLHWWFPTYDTELSKYSPGMILLLETIRAATKHGITRIDLGKGEERYKLSFMTGRHSLCEGSVDANKVIHSLRTNCADLKQKALSTSAGKAAKTLIKRLRSKHQ